MKTSATLERILVRAPSNIALVKYMGKKTSSDSAAPLNLPENASVSMTLSRLCTFIELRVAADISSSEAGRFRWLPESPSGVNGESPRLAEKGIQKFIAHANRSFVRAGQIFSSFGIDARDADFSFEIRTANTFPHAAGIASSASSFAGLTLAVLTARAFDRSAFRKKYLADSDLRAEIAKLSREGSGSSCRSFDGPFVSWDDETVRAILSTLPPLSDIVVVVASGEKEVGSSEAHRRVKTSAEWPGRVARATHRHSAVLEAITTGDFESFRLSTIADSRDMHRLFETSIPSFSYRTDASRAVIDFVETLRVGNRRLEVAITLDAGPNVHLIVPATDEDFLRRKLVERFPEFPLLVDRAGNGAEILEIGASDGTVSTPSKNGWNSYAVTVPGKWVLAGEHAVLRGGRAIALPHPTFSLQLDFRPSDRNLEVEPDLGAVVVQDLLRIARDWLLRRGTKMEMPRGILRVRSTIPFGAGLGSSAALSVAIARWVLGAHSLDRNLERDLAREMEDRFHGKSSGMDVAAVSIGEPILFSMREGAVGLGLRHLPEFKFIDTGLRSSTLDCVGKVKALGLTDPAKADELDRKMGCATDQILAALRRFDDAKDRTDTEGVSAALEEIAAGMRETRVVYEGWDLIPEEVSQEFSRLGTDSRILSARITGAGAGGFIVALVAADH